MSVNNATVSPLTPTSFSFTPGPAVVTSNSQFTVRLTTSVPPVTQKAPTSAAAPAPAPAASPSTTSTSSSSSTTSSSSNAVVVPVLTTVRSHVTTGAAAEATTIVVTSTQSTVLFPSDTRTTSSTSTHSSPTSSGSAPLSTSGADTDKSSGGLSPAGRIAVAVVVPVAAVALIVLALLFWWRKRKQRKDAEELRRKEVEEYGFNPNEDPTLPPIGGASSNGDEPSEMRESDGAGYRGWGTTSTARKPSTTLSSGNGIGIARSGSGSDPGGYQNGSPSAGTAPNSDSHSNDPLVDRPLSGDSETIGALGAAPAAGGNRQDQIHRGPSNASSAYSGAHRSDTSGDGMIPGGAPSQQYYNEAMFYDEGMPQHGPYGDGSYGGGGQPVIRDVQARRNTRIENPTVFPQQGNAGIAQNF